MRNESENIAKILQMLRKAGDKHVSGEKISKTLGMSRAYLWKYIHKLREYGYDIGAGTHKGYKLLCAPDKLFEFEVRSGLKTGVFGKNNILYFDNIDSTNIEAYKLADSGSPEGVLVVAEKQSAGKGRLGRKWVSPKGGIYFSLILKPTLPLEDVPVITLIAANAVAKAIKDSAGIEVKIKWPNDVFSGDKKICGILTEMKAQPDNIDFVVMGIGINVNIRKDLLPVSAGSIDIESGKVVNRLDLLKSILFEFENRYNVLCEKGFKAIRKECKNMSFLIGKEVKVSRRGGITKGTAVDINERGALVIKDASGKEHNIYAGDVELCRV